MSNLFVAFSLSEHVPRYPVRGTSCRQPSLQAPSACAVLVWRSIRHFPRTHLHSGTSETASKSLVGLHDIASAARFTLVGLRCLFLSLSMHIALVVYHHLFEDSLSVSSTDSDCVGVSSPSLQYPSVFGIHLGSEDCLYINVHTPANAAERAAAGNPLPVMVWIYGTAHRTTPCPCHPVVVALCPVESPLL